MAKKTQARPKKKMNKIPFIVAGVVAIIAAVAAMVYFAVSPSPEERVTNGLAKLITSDVVAIESVSTSGVREDASSTITIKATTNKQLLDADVAIRVTSPGQEEFTASAEAVMPEDGNLYMKVEDSKNALPELANSMLSAELARNGSFAQNESMISGVRELYVTEMRAAADRIDDKWVMLPKSQFSISTLQEEVSTGCYIDFLRELQSDKAAREEIVERLSEGGLIVIEDTLESKGTSAGYRISLDQAKFEEFMKSLEDNAAISKIFECDPSFELLNSIQDTQMDVWVDRISRSITHMEFADSTDAETTRATKVMFGYSGRLQVSQPSEVIEFSEAFNVPGAVPPEETEALQ